MAFNPILLPLVLLLAGCGLAQAQSQPSAPPQPQPPSKPAAQQQAKPPGTPPASRTLADQLNVLVDGLYREVGMMMRPGQSEPLGPRLQRGIDEVYGATGRTALAVGRATAQSARELGLDGPTLFPPRVLAAADGQINPNARMTLLQAWQAARTNDPNLRAARAALSAAQERLPQARAQLLPQVQLGVTRFSNVLERDGQNTLAQQLNITDRYPSANDTLSLRQPLVRLQQAVGVQQAKAVLREANSIFSKEEQDFSLRVVLSYFENLLALDQLQLIESQGSFLQTSLVAAQRALQGGTGTRTDVDAAQAKLDLNQAQLLEARQQVEFSRRQLQALVDRPFGQLAPLDPVQLDKLAVPREGLQEWLDKAERQSPEILRLQAQRDGMRQELNKARAGHMPTVDLVAQLQRSRSENTISPQSRYQNASVGVQVNVPLYNGGYTNSVTRQVSAEIERLDEELRALQLDIGVRVHREYRGISEGMLRVKALEAAVRSADVALDSARKSVQAGVRTVVDVLNAEQQRMQALRDLAQARYSLLVSVVKLQALVAENDETLVARLSSVLAP